MKLRGTLVATVCCSLLFLDCAGAQDHTPLDIQIRLPSGTVLLGEPVWVLVTARNIADKPILWNPGEYCFMFSQQPVTAVVSSATPGGEHPQPCTYGPPGGDCFVGGNTTEISPGESATREYLLEGDFHFTRAGTYQVVLTSHPGKVFSTSGGNGALFPQPAPVTETLTLMVLPKDDAALLIREKEIAAKIEAEIPAQRHIQKTTAERETYWRQGQNLLQVRRGLAMHPAPGMESVFIQWLQLRNDFEDDAITGLKNLNSQEARTALEKLAETPNKPDSYTQEAAAYALDDMGDRKYFSLMVQLLASPNQRVRRAAIAGIGRLEGDSGVTKLVEIAHTGNTTDQRDVLTALGNTDSRLGVKALIDLMTATDIPDRLDAEWPLFVLTHHHLEKVSYRRTPEEAHDAWQHWWDMGGKEAPVYSSYECAPKGAL